MQRTIVTLGLLLPIASCGSGNTDSGRQYSAMEPGSPMSYSSPAVAASPFAASAPMRRKGFRGTSGQTTIDD
jgi:hypothetical protein